MALKTATRIVVDISRKFHLDIAYIDLPALPLPSTFCVYQAALLHIHLSDQAFMQPDWKADMESLKSALAHFGRRWAIGSR